MKEGHLALSQPAKGLLNGLVTGALKEIIGTLGSVALIQFISAKNYSETIVDRPLNICVCVYFR